MIDYNDYDLPAWNNGVRKERPIPFKFNQPLFGKGYTELVSDSLSEIPCTWEVSLICKESQASELKRLYDDVRDDVDGYFTRLTAAEFGSNVQRFKFISGIPQPVRLSNGFLSFSIRLYSDIVDSTIDEPGDIVVTTGTARWGEYGLPDFIRGYRPTQIDPVERTPVFAGPLYDREISSDLPVIWNVSLICNRKQARRLVYFYKTYSGIASKYFIHSMTTTEGRKEQYLRIISGIPTGQQISSDVWRFNMTLESPSLNLDTDTLPSF
jgi:hypothetical protein